jgi:hypothetical protein
MARSSHAGAGVVIRGALANGQPEAARTCLNISWHLLLLLSAAAAVDADRWCQHMQVGRIIEGVVAGWAVA